MNRGIDKATKDFEEAAKKTSAVAEEFASGVSQVFEESLFNNFNKGLKGMYSAFTDMLRRMAAQLLASRLVGMMGLSPGGAAYNFIGGQAGDLSGKRAGGGSVER